MGTGNGLPPTSRFEQFLDKVRADLVVRDYSARTVDAYVGWIRRYVVFHGRRHPTSMNAPEVAAYLSHLANVDRASASTQNQALAALLFLYTKFLKLDLGSVDGLVHARGPARLPAVLSANEVQALLSRLSGASHLAASILYGGGLRLQECVSLRLKDLDFDASQITVRSGKGDRCIPEALTGLTHTGVESTATVTSYGYPLSEPWGRERILWGFVEVSGGREGAERRLRREGVCRTSTVTSQRRGGCGLDAERQGFVKRGWNSAMPGGFISASGPAVYSAPARFSQFDCPIHHCRLGHQCAGQ